ncbi:MAG: A/G-specific adenine glycosylase [Oscillospiraceae bacterium]|nr:A/G-specific adenine glycosylase [Oscillospiraceae bacterium]
MDEIQQKLNAMAPLLLPWYDTNRRELPWRETRDPYAIWVSEIMLQQTRVAAVLPYYARWMERLPDAAALAAVDEEELMKLWQGLGYYSRARNLQKAAQVIVAEYGGRLPNTYETLKKLPGVGDYTAGAVASIAFGQAVSAVDGNVLRVAARVANIRENMLDEKVKKTMRVRMDDAVSKERPGEFNQALMDLGATVCLPNGKPLCENCPLAEICEAKRLGITQELPVRTKKAPRRIEEMTVYLLLRGEKVAVRKRADEGLLAGLWEFPHVTGRLDEQDAARVLADWNLMPRDWKKTIAARHIFTHLEWHMTGYLLAVDGEGADDFIWVNREQLGALAVPGAFKKYLAESMEVLEAEK